MINRTHYIVVDMIIIWYCLCHFFRHQKFFGPVKFITNDPNQPKRILIGTQNNVIGAVHGNTGSVNKSRNGLLMYFHLRMSCSSLLQWLQ